MLMQTVLARNFSRRYIKPRRKPIQPILRWRIGKGDIVQVNSGKDKGKIGEVLKVDRKKNRVTVEGVNIKLKRKLDQSAEDGESQRGIETIQHGIRYSNVNLVDPETGVGTKTRFAYLADGTKVRISRDTGTIIPKPERENLTYKFRS